MNSQIINKDVFSPNRETVILDRFIVSSVRFFNFCIDNIGHKYYNTWQERKATGRDDGRFMDLHDNIILNRRLKHDMVFKCQYNVPENTLYVFSIPRLPREEIENTSVKILNQTHKWLDYFLKTEEFQKIIMATMWYDGTGFFMLKEENRTPEMCYYATHCYDIRHLLRKIPGVFEKSEQYEQELSSKIPEIMIKEIEDGMGECLHPNTYGEESL